MSFMEDKTGTIPDFTKIMGPWWMRGNQRPMGLFGRLLGGSGSFLSNILNRRRSGGWSQLPKYPGDPSGRLPPGVLDF